MVEFPSLELARACYDDPEYRHAMTYALANSERKLPIFVGNVA